MNVWMDIAIPALVTVAALAVLDIIEWREAHRCREVLEIREAQLNERDGQAIAQANRIVDLLAENGKLQLQLDEALRPKTLPVVETASKKPARTPRANSRAKPPTQE